MTPDEEDAYLRYVEGQAHVVIRARQRYGIDIDIDAVRLLEKGVRTGAFPLCAAWRGARGDTYRLHETFLHCSTLCRPLSFEDAPVRLVFLYSENSGHILSFYPVEAARALAGIKPVKHTSRSERRISLQQHQRRARKKQNRL